MDGFDGSFLKMPGGAPVFALEDVRGFRSVAVRDRPDRQIEGKGSF